MSLISNERTKFLATWLNTIASAAVILGVIAPLAAAFYGASVSDAPSPFTLALGALIWFFSGLALHLGVRRILRSLKEWTLTKYSPFYSCRFP